MDTLLEIVRMTAREIMKTPAAVAAYLALGGVVIGTALAFRLISPVFDGFVHCGLKPGPFRECSHGRRFRQVHHDNARKFYR